MTPPPRLLGVLDITGGDDIALPQTMAMVRAAARMAESELARELLRRRGAGGTPTGRHVRGHRVSRPAGLPADHRRRPRHRQTIRLVPRHSEILLLLASAPSGLSGDELAVLLYEEDGGASTLSAELNRLRNLLGDQLLASRPYRLVAEVTADWLAVEAQLAAGDLRPRCACIADPLRRARPRRAWCACASTSRRRCARPCSQPTSPT